MSKIILIPAVMALLAALVGGGAVFAVEALPPAAETATEMLPGTAGFGATPKVAQVTAIGENQFTVQSRQGITHTLLIDAETSFYRIGGDEAAFADLQVGGWVTGRVIRDDAGELLAKAVILLPEGFDPEGITGRAGGSVTAVDTAAGTFTLENQDGEIQVFTVEAGTLYLGSVAGLEDLQVDMAAAVGVKALEDGSLVAAVLRAGYPVIRHAGAISTVDADAGTFTLETHRGEVLTFSVDESTRFFSRDELVGGLADLQVDMVATVGANQQEDGSYLAVGVGAATRDQLPQFDLRVGGKVLSIGADSFTLGTRSGEEVTFQIDAATRFRSPGNFIQSLEDLKPGMIVGVGAQELEDGSYLAQGVLAIRR